MISRKFGRIRDNRNHLIRNLLTSLVLYEKLVTTEAKAKTLKSEIDRVITNAKKGGLIGRRYLDKILFDKNAVKKTIEVLVPRYENRNSGYTRVVRLGNRLGDGAPKFQIQFIEEVKKEKTATKVIQKNNDDLAIVDKDESHKDSEKKKAKNA